MPIGVAGGLAQGLAQGIQVGTQLQLNNEITKARSEFFKALTKQNEAEAKIQANRLKMSLFVQGNQDQPITEQNIPGAAPLSGGEEIGAFPPTSQAGEQDQLRRMLAAAAAGEGQFGQAFQLLQPPREAFTATKLGDKLIGVFQDPQTGNVRTQVLATGDVKSDDFTSMGTLGNNALVLNKRTGQVIVNQTGVDVPDKPPRAVTSNELQLIAGGQVIPGIDITAEQAKSALKAMQEQRVEVAERTGAAAQERREKAELDKSLNVTGDLFMKPIIRDGQLQFERPSGTTSVGQAGEKGFLNVTQQRTAIEKISEAQNALRILDSLQPMATELIQAEPGLKNILTQALAIQTDKLSKSGELTNFRNEEGKQLTRGELASLYNRRLKALTRTLGRASGEKGVFTDRDVADFKETLPTILDTATGAQTFLDEQRRFFADKIEEQVRNIFGRELTPPNITQTLVGGQQAAPAPAAPPKKPAKAQPKSFGDVLRSQTPEVRRGWQTMEDGFFEGTVTLDQLRAVGQPIFGDNTEVVIRFLVEERLKRLTPPTVPR